ncbi:MAG: hypothetical protein R3F14_00060 [Polyangiaceae bacterium]
MDARRLGEIRHLRDLLTALDEQSINLMFHLSSLQSGGNNGEVVVRANREGLVHLARIGLSLATQSNVGSHYHLDETGVVDHCEMPLVLVLAKADWEKDEPSSNS